MQQDVDGVTVAAGQQIQQGVSRAAVSTIALAVPSVGTNAVVVPRPGADSQGAGQNENGRDPPGSIMWM